MTRDTLSMGLSSLWLMQFTYRMEPFEACWGTWCSGNTLGLLRGLTWLPTGPNLIPCQAKPDPKLDGRCHSVSTFPVPKESRLSHPTWRASYASLGYIPSLSERTPFPGRRQPSTLPHHPTTPPQPPPQPQFPFSFLLFFPPSPPQLIKFIPPLSSPPTDPPRAPKK